MKTISIDVETYSGEDLARSGVYRYTETPDFEILLFGYAIDGGEVTIVDLARGEQIPSDVLAALENDTVIKWAFNANFERVGLSRMLGYPTGTYLNPTSWRCTRLWAAYLGLPSTLQECGKVLNLDKQKLVEGKELIKFFCTPCKTAQSNGSRLRNRPSDFPEKWELFKEYNRRDVEAEMEIQRVLSEFPRPGEDIWEVYILDQIINDTGVAVDLPFVEKALKIAEASKDELTTSFRALTNIENPNSPLQMKRWLTEQGFHTQSLKKEAVYELLNIVPSDVKEVLQLYQQLSKTSVKKYEAMLNTVCSDGRVRGMFQFYGTHTGRWSGRLVQLQNLPKNHMNDLDEARELVRCGDLEGLKKRNEDVPDTLSQLIRTAFVPIAGKKYIVEDFSAIEARVLAWLAEEDWRLQAFEKGEDIYCASASQMFGIPVVKNGINGHLRAKGKIAELALGYGGTKKALIDMGALEMGLTEDELTPLVRSWREANPNIVAFWYAVNRSSVEAVRQKGLVMRTHGIGFLCKQNLLLIRLPSGRLLSYPAPQIGVDQDGRDGLTYMGMDSQKKWCSIRTYGARLVENVVQAIARDILSFALQKLKKHKIVMHIHDEVVLEVDECVSEDTIRKVMEIRPPWAADLPLHAEGFEAKYYKKE